VPWWQRILPLFEVPTEILIPIFFLPPQPPRAAVPDKVVIASNARAATSTTGQSNATIQ
jgi:hypothetical protein